LTIKIFLAAVVKNS